MIKIEYNNYLCPSKIYIDTPSTTETLRIINQLIQDKIINIDGSRYAHLYYDSNLGLPKNETDNHFYPLIIHLNYIDVFIRSAAAGFEGNGPKDTIEILKTFGIELDCEEERLISHATFDEHGERIHLVSHTFFKHNL